MSQRDTLVPVCKIVGVAANSTVANIPVVDTGLWVEKVETSALSLSAVIGTQPSAMPGNFGRQQEIAFLVSSILKASPYKTWASGVIVVRPSDGTNTIIEETRLNRPGAYTSLVGEGLNASTVVVMPDFSGIQITSITLAGSAGGAGFGSVGDADVSLALFSSATSQATIAWQQNHAASSILTMTDQGSNRIVQFTPGNYPLDTSFTDNDLSLFGAGWTGTTPALKFMSENPAQLVLSSLAGDASGVFTITSGNTGAIFTTTMSKALANVNYVTVTDLSGDAGFFKVAAASGNGYYVSSDGQAPLTAWLGGSGVPGTIGAAGTTVVISTATGLSGIDIENQTDVASIFAINYGVIKQSNTIGDQIKTDVK